MYNRDYTLIITKKVGQLAQWIDKKHVRDQTQYKCSRCNVCDKRGASICICKCLSGITFTCG